MCGRYYIDDQTWDAVREDFPELSLLPGPVLPGAIRSGEASPGSAHPGGSASVLPGDVTPAMKALALCAGAPGRASAGSGDLRTAGLPQPTLPSGQPDPPARSVRLSPLTWGFPGRSGKGLVINARAEGIAQKPMFSDSIRARRCVLPAAGFYEWDRSKEKVRFRLAERPVIYLAGIFRPYGAEERFAIITREANGSMLPVHDRMPLMIAPEDVRDWIRDPGQTERLLTQPLPELSAERDYEQMSLF